MDIDLEIINRNITKVEVNQGIIVAKYKYLKLPKEYYL
jgi:hypothetical protein